MFSHKHHICKASPLCGPIGWSCSTAVWVLVLALLLPFSLVAILPILVSLLCASMVWTVEVAVIPATVAVEPGVASHWRSEVVSFRLRLFSRAILLGFLWRVRLLSSIGRFVVALWWWGSLFSAAL